MCSIYGAIGHDIDFQLLARVQLASQDRGRDGGNSVHYPLADGSTIVLGNWRATPTPELEEGHRQPYKGIVHNGTIANDEELGLREGEIDSEVLPRILDRKSLDNFATSLGCIKGSYAIAAVGEAEDCLYLACNYKPIYIYQREGAWYFSSLERHLMTLVLDGTRPVKMEPYTALSLPSNKAIKLRPEPEKSAVIIASAGLDSTCVATKLIHDGWFVHLLHFQYGCRAQAKESECIKKIAKFLGVTYSYQDLPYTNIGGSPLLETGTEIAKGIEGAEYAYEWVPARNLVMLAYATAYAEARGYSYIALGNNLEEAGAYPDNEEEFTILFDQLLDNAVQEGAQVRVISPVAHLMKKEVVALGLKVGAPFHETWSCYKGGEIHCGECGPCFMRRTAFERNGVIDPVPFANGRRP